jgi:hypothetical protein
MAITFLPRNSGKLHREITPSVHTMRLYLEMLSRIVHQLLIGLAHGKISCPSHEPEKILKSLTKVEAKKTDMDD